MRYENASQRYENTSQRYENDFQGMKTLAKV
jgi:hypothetical protein